MKKKKAVVTVLITVGSVVAAGLIALALILEPSVKISGFHTLEKALLEANSDTLSIVDASGEAVPTSFREYAPLSALPRYTSQAFIAVEDKRFYAHHGVDFRRVIGATIKNITHFSFKEGASTITQQLIKNTHLSQEKTLKRKVEEIRLARALEREYSKEQILEAYLNIIYFGSGVYGVANAARTYFDKETAQLTLAESAALAAIIKNPSGNNPYYHSDVLKQRRDLVLDLMREQNLISESELEAAKREQLTVKEKSGNGQFVQSVLDECCAVLKTDKRTLLKSGYKIFTDYNRDLSATIKLDLKDFVSAQKSDNQYVRVLIIDNNTRTVIADASNAQSDMHNLKRSPASCIKPFLSYAPSIDNGSVHTISILNDVPTDFEGYSPRNYKDSYDGYISVTDALIKSKNVPAVALCKLNGLPYCMGVARRFGIEFDESDDHLSVALGAMKNGVTLRTLADAYATLACEGVYQKGAYVTRIQNKSGVTIYSRASNSERAVLRDTAYLVNKMLLQCSKRGTARVLAGFENVAAKTGTSGEADGNTDCYCVAYSPDYTVAVWCGASEGKIDNSITGSTCASLVGAAFTSLGEQRAFTRPSTVVEMDIDARTLNSTHKIVRAPKLLAKRYRLRAEFAGKFAPKEKRAVIIRPKR